MTREPPNQATVSQRFAEEDGKRYADENDDADRPLRGTSAVADAGD